LRPAWTLVALMACLFFASACADVTSSPGHSPSSVPADRIYVSQAGSSTLAVIDALSGKTTEHIEVGMLPHNLVLSADGRTLYVALVGSQAVAEIDVATNSLRRTMLTAPVPERRPDGTVIQEHIDQAAFGATTCYGCHRPEGAQPKYAGDRPFGLLLSPDRRSLYVTHLRGSRLAVLNLADGSIKRTIFLAPAGASTEAVAIDRVDAEIWIALRPPQPSTLPGALRRLDANTLEAIGDVATGSDVGALLALSEQGRMLVSNFETNTVTMYDTRAGATAGATAGAAGGTGAPLSPSSPLAPRAIEVAPGPLGLLALPGERALAVDYYFNAVSLLDLKTGTAETMALTHDGVPYANPTNAALSSNGKSAWIVTSGTEGHIIQLDLTTRTLVQDLPIDGLSFGIAVVPRTESIP